MSDEPIGFLHTVLPKTEYDALRARAERAERALKRVEELHSQAFVRADGGEFCTHCQRRWPCPTIQAISEERE